MPKSSFFDMVAVDVVDMADVVVDVVVDDTFDWVGYYFYEKQVNDPII
jgi:hypothetical protein